MKKIIIPMILLILLPVVFAVSNPVTFNAKTYYKVTSLDSTEDTGDEVCTKVGLVCKGYTEPSTAVCLRYHPNAADTQSLSGDKAGAYCNGGPQAAVCATLKDTCHACPACTNTVTCSQKIGGLYREMFVECVKPSASQKCTISFSANNVNSFFNAIPSLNAQLKACPQQLPSAARLLVSNGNIVGNIGMLNGQTRSFTVMIQNRQVVGIKSGGGTCAQQVSIRENDFNSILQSSSISQTVQFLIGQKKITLTGCTFFRSALNIVLNPIARFFSRRNVPTAPPPKPKPDCGKLGEQCNNRGCLSGICASPKENINGQWRFVNYRCIDQRDWNNYCQGHGNTPPAWDCLTRPCQ